MKMSAQTDPRRFGVITVRFHPGPPTLYRLTIGGQLWAAVEWSAVRRAWCIEDAAGHCLAHCEHVHGEHIDQQTAVALAKAMIRDGRVPTPEEANRQLEESQSQRRLQEQEQLVPWQLLADPVREPE
jgi:hypothetical protein